MPPEPKDWNAVVLGRWNRAILTPRGIITELFREPEETEVQIEIPFDMIGPYRVVHDSLVVVADWGRLLVETQEHNLETLCRAMEIARRAMDYLPVTPFVATGYNVRYQVDASDSDAQPLIDSLSHAADARLTEAGYSVVGRGFSRTVEWSGGRILVSLSRSQDSLDLGMNFECRGEDEKMKGWLTTSADEIREQVVTVCRETFQMRTEALPWS